MNGLRYAIVSPIRNEAANVSRLATILARQTIKPVAWVLVDTGSTDDTGEIATELAASHDWITFERAAETTSLARGAPIVRAFHQGLDALGPVPDVIVKLDADITMERDYFERVLAEFNRDARLGIAGGIGYEKQSDGVWRQRHGTGAGVWGACRGYRRACLEQLLPLEERMGWDTLDLMKAAALGWRAKTFLAIPFRHHRVEGERDGSRVRTWIIQGGAAHYMGYRVSYLLARTVYRMLQEPAAVGLLLGYLASVVQREPRCSDTALIRYVRAQQRLRNLPIRIREARRPRAALGEPA